MSNTDNSVYEAQDLAALMHHCEEFGDIPLFVSKEYTVTYKEYALQVRRILSALFSSEEKIIVLNIKDQILLAEVWMAAALSGHNVCLLPDDYSIPKSIQTALLIDDEEASRLRQSEPYVGYPIQDPKKVCTIAFSSGTTSEAKGVMLTQQNLLLDTEYSIRYCNFYKGMRLVHILPYWHLFGLAADLLVPLHCGCSVYIPMGFHQMEAISVFKPHSINLTPAFADALVSLIRQIGDVKKVTGGCLKRVLCGGAPYSEQTERALLEYGILPYTGYGLTECSPCVSITRDGDYQLQTAGVPLECVKIRISPDGEILVSGDTVMAGYYRDPQGTDERIRDGWLHTGDLGYLDDTGHLVITGRLSNMLVLPSGKKVIPETIEALISRYPGIYECCLSMPDKKLALEVVSTLPYESVKKMTDAVMVDKGLIPYELSVYSHGLKRNKMGKVIR